MKKGSKSLVNRLVLVAFSLTFSFFLWLSLAGQDTNAIDLSVPLEMTNLPADLALRSEVPTSVTFQVLANTAQSRFMADRKLQVKLDVGTAREGSNAFPIDRDSLDLPRGVTVRKVSPAVIEFEAVRVSRKIVPLTPTVEGQLNPAYLMRSLVLEPDRVTVVGPQDKVRNLESLPTSPIDIQGLNRDIILNVTPSPAQIEPGTEVSPREIKVNITVEERRTEETFKKIPIQIDLKNSGDTSHILISPNRADISVAWPASRTRAVTAEDIKVHVFIDEDRLKAEGRLAPPVVAVAPPGVDITAIDPINATVTRKDN